MAGQLDFWSFIGAERTASGYPVALHIPGTDQYTVWNTDGRGNFVSNGNGGVVVSGTGVILESLETSFHQDLNGDHVTGPSPSSPSAAAFFAELAKHSLALR
ncbi:hypothetical protein ABIC03_002167 [Bradyrhizobium sp. RT6a]|uniref:hypothetical protein n=1 Tax=Bradyrhizobium sp. RT6a TaxID=3156381 RepID=UPI00339905DF